MYLLDSDILINFLKGKTLLSREVLRSDLYVSIINYIEVTFGNLKHVNSEKLQDEFLGFIRMAKVKILPVDKEISDRYLSLRIDLETSGSRLEHFDLFIGATAIQHNLILVTNNKKHFSRIYGLQLA